MRTLPNPFDTPRFTVTAAMTNRLYPQSVAPSIHQEERQISHQYAFRLEEGQSARQPECPSQRPPEGGDRAATRGRSFSFEEHLARQEAAWRERWEGADVMIEGDLKAQQCIRFNLFQLFCTYYGEDERLNIGPKGFTREKYGGTAHWDTKGFLIPMYLSVADPSVTEKLLRYRRNQLPGAYLNASRQGLAGALYPMVTFNGVECHNEWEITFEEIYRNGAIVYAIYHYTSYTGDDSYLLQEGIDVLVAISRFWADRVHLSKGAGQYMIHGVTGPNEYENTSIITGTQIFWPAGCWSILWKAWSESPRRKKRSWPSPLRRWSGYCWSHLPPLR